MHLLGTCILALLSACVHEKPAPHDSASAAQSDSDDEILTDTGGCEDVVLHPDEDGDGTDCNDADAAVNPGAIETCDGDGLLTLPPGAALGSSWPSYATCTTDGVSSETDASAWIEYAWSEELDAVGRGVEWFDTIMVSTDNNHPFEGEQRHVSLGQAVAGATYTW